MSIFSELKRRNIFKIGVAYLIVAWLLMQVTDLAAPALRLPEWVTTFVVFILAIGFPVALLLAWAFEVTPDGIKKTKQVSLEKSIRGITGHKLNYAVIALLGIAVVFLLFERNNPPPDPESSDSQEDGQISIAVLPFVNMSDDPNSEHFADGLTEELLNSLAAVDDLRVTSRTSSFSFKGQSLPLGEIAERLGVDHILEGSVRRSGDRIRVTAQLIASEEDEHIWSDVFDRALTIDNILEIQENVATTVVDALEARLRPEEFELIRGNMPANLEALESYYDGQYVIRRLWTGEGDFNDRGPFDQAVAAFERSIAADDDWAPAHAALGSAYHLWRNIGGQEQQFAIAKEHIGEALRLDPDYGPAYLSLAYMAIMEGNPDAAIEAYERANSLGAESHVGKGILNFSLARYDESVEHYRKAVSIDPVSTQVKVQMMWSLYCADRTRELEGFAEQLSQLVPDNPQVRSLLAYAYARNGDSGNAMALVREVEGNEESNSWVAIVLALVGETDRARAVLLPLSPEDQWSIVVPTAILLGEIDWALDILEDVEARQPVRLANVRCSPEIIGLRGNPRFDALLDRLALPE